MVCRFDDIEPLSKLILKITIKKLNICQSKVFMNSLPLSVCRKMMVRFGIMPLSTQLFKVTDSIQSFFTEYDNSTYQTCIEKFLNILCGEFSK